MTFWTLTENLARWTDGSTLLSFDKMTPGRGLSVFTPPVATEPLLELFGAGPDSEVLSALGPLTELASCAASISARFDKKPPSLVDTYWDWRAQKSAGTVTIDLVLSASTQSLETSVDVFVRSRATAAEILMAGNPAAAHPDNWVPVEPGSDLVTQGASCVLLRLPEIGLSYAEMFPPSGSLAHTLRIGWEPESGRVLLCRQLFSCRVEKGVLLRTTMRGALLPRESDCQVAASLFAQFASSDPPLGR